MSKTIKRKYIKEIKKNLVYIGRKEKEYLKTLENEIDQFKEIETTYEDIIERFGTPKEIADSYMMEYDEGILKRKVRTKGILISFFIVFIMGTVFVCMLRYIDFKKAEESFINREEVIIEETPSPK